MLDGLENWASGAAYIRSIVFRDWNLRLLLATWPEIPSSERPDQSLHMDRAALSSRWRKVAGLEALTGEKSRPTAAAAAAFAKLCFLFCKPMGKVTVRRPGCGLFAARLWFMAPQLSQTDSAVRRRKIREYL